MAQWPILGDDQQPAVCRLFWLPSGDIWEAIGRGSIDALTEPDHWKGYDDTPTPEEIAATYEPLISNSFRKWHGLWNAHVQKFMALYDQSLIAYWPLFEALGATQARDIFAARHGIVTGATWGATGIGDGQTAVTFDGVGDVINCYGTSLRDAFNGSTGSLIIWAKATAALWTDGLAHVIARFRSANNSYVYLYKPTTGSLYFEYQAGAVLNQIVKATTTIDWMVLAITWDKNAEEMKAYFNGVQEGATQSPLGVWSGLLSSGTTLLGANLTSGAFSWLGTLAHAALFNRALTPTEVAHVSVVQT